LVRSFPILLAVLLVAGVASIGVWRWHQHRQPPPLPRGWRAVVAVLAGDGVSAARDGSSSRARFSDPFGVAAAPDGSIYVSDAGEAQAVRRIAPDGTVSTTAGGELGYADGPATAARFRTPSGLAIAANGTIYVADTGNNMIRRISPDGEVSTVAGGLAAGYRDAIGREARFNGPIGVAVDSSGRIIVADTYNDRIRAIEPDGTVVTLAGSGDPGAVDGPSGDACFDTPSGVAVDAQGRVFVADTGNGAVRMITPDGFVSTIGPPPAYGLLRPAGIAVSDAGVVYVTDDRGRVVEIEPGVTARTLAGSRPGFADGVGDDARFRSLAGVAWVAAGRLVVTDGRNALVRIVAERSRLGLRAPASPRITPRFDAERFALEPLLWPLDPMEGPFEITGTLGEARGGNGSERFHAGVDVHAADGSVVRAVRNGIVSEPITTADFGTLNESVRIGPIAYVHLRVGRSRDDQILDPARFVGTYDETGRLTQVRVRRGARFTTGDAIGTVNRFNHVHLNVGWPGEEHNPLRFRLVHFEDTVPPTIARGGVRVIGEHGLLLTERKNGRLVVDGRVRVVVDAWDQVNGNERRRRLGLYQLGYQVLQSDGSPATGFEKRRETIRFDRLAPDDMAAPAVYASGSGIPFFGNRSTRFFYTVTNRLQNGVADTAVWDTATLPPGDYTLRIIASDIEGNEATINRDVPITIVP
jgi:sugar lactone lactonase YvrE